MNASRLLDRRAFLALGAFTLASCGGGGRGSLRREAETIVGGVRPPSGGGQRKHLLQTCARVARMGLPYRFGGESPAEGGMDCSGTIHYLLVNIGYQHPPRQSNHQFLWCEEQGTLKSWHGGGAPRGIRPGDLLFWKNTYHTGRRYPANISHVMVYMGRDRGGQYWQFGGRGSRARGEHGAGIDFHKFDPSKGPFGRGELVGWARVPWLKG